MCSKANLKFRTNYNWCPCLSRNDYCDITQGTTSGFCHNNKTIPCTLNQCVPPVLKDFLGNWVATGSIKNMVSGKTYIINENVTISYMPENMFNIHIGDRDGKYAYNLTAAPLGNKNELIMKTRYPPVPTSDFEYQNFYVNEQGVFTSFFYNSNSIHPVQILQGYKTLSRRL